MPYQPTTTVPLTAPPSGPSGVQPPPSFAPFELFEQQLKSLNESRLFLEQLVRDLRLEIVGLRCDNAEMRKQLILMATRTQEPKAR